MSEGAAATLGTSATTTSTAGVDTASQQTSPDPATTPGGDPSWAESFAQSLSEQPQLAKIFTERRWESPTQMLESYRQLESMRGVPPEQLLKLPGDEANPEDWGPVYERLGRPEKPDGYTFDEAVEAESQIKVLPQFRALAHDLGLSDAQAKSIVEWYGGAVKSALGSLETESAEQRATRIASEEVALRKEWGLAYDERDQFADRALRQYFPGEGVGQKLVDALGFGETMKVLSQIGEAMSEHRPPDVMGPGGGFAGTPEWGKAKIAKLKSDPEWVARYLEGKPSERAEMEAAQKAAYPDI